MRAIKTLLLASALSFVGGADVSAEERGHDMNGEHGAAIFHMFRLEAGYGTNLHDGIASWDMDGWVGSDENKLWLKSEGEHAGGEVEDAEFWALYSRNVTTFWDAQLGIRHDVEPDSRAYAVIGVNGLAPYFFETEAHLFIGDEGDVSARLRGETDLLVTQKLILQPYAEADLFAQDVPEREIGAGLADGKIGVHIRYEFTRKYAPYLDIHYDRKFGQTASIAERNGEDKGEFAAAIGLRLMF